MKSTVDKIETLRTATAQARIKATPTVLDALMSGNTPKGNALDVARAAGLLAAKRTWETIPHCHPIPIDRITIDFVREDGAIMINTSVTAIWKTGVEMEALMGASVAALTLFDIGKAISAEMEIGEIRVVEKKGGKSDWQENIPADFRAAVIVTSDGTFAGKREDKSGKVIRERLEQFGIANISYAILPDDRVKIAAALNKLASEGVHLVCTTGGTGLGPRDVTVEATREVIEREISGIAEAMRSFGQRRTPYAMLSRGIVGVKGKTVIVNLPGSSRGVKESLDAIFPGVLHVYPMMAGGGH